MVKNETTKFKFEKYTKLFIPTRNLYASESLTIQNRNKVMFVYIKTYGF